MLLTVFSVQTVGKRSTTRIRAFSTAEAAGAHYDGRPTSFKDLQDDVHARLTNGDSVSYSFTGSGISYVSEKSDCYGLVDVYLDGTLQATVDANASGLRNAGGQVLFAKSGLSAGQHTIKLVKKSGLYMLLDALTVLP